MPNEPMAAGPVLDRLCCEALTKAGAQGWHPVSRFILSRDGGNTGINWSDNRAELESFVAEHPIFLQDGGTE
jgi:hypothetical protein